MKPQVPSIEQISEDHELSRRRLAAMRYSSYIAAAAAFPTLPFASPSSPKGHGKARRTEITVQPDEKYQLIEGFGFSGAFQRAQLLLNVTEQVQQELFDLIYSTETGVGFSMVRNGIGSSNSSFNDLMNSHLPVSPGSPDAEPEYVWDEYDSGQLALSIKAVEYGVKRFYANAWSSPGFMKNNSDDANGGLLCGVEGSFEEGTQCKYDWRQAYADYFVKYIRLYASHGVNVTEVGFLNEPDLTTPYASMRSDAQQTADFLPVLYDTLEREGLGHVGIACCEHTGWHETAENIAGLQELGAEKYLSHVTSHEYSGNISYQLDTDRRVWQTEYCDLSNDWNPYWDGVNRGDGWRWAFILHKALTVGNVNAYYWWLVVQDRDTNDNKNEKLIKVEDGEYEVSKRTWSFAHFARYIRPDAYRIGVSGNDDLYTSACVNEDGSYVVVVLNPSYEGRKVSVDLGKCSGVKKVRAYLTDEEHDMEEVEVAWRRGVATAELSSRGLMTFRAV